MQEGDPLRPRGRCTEFDLVEREGALREGGRMRRSPEALDRHDGQRGVAGSWTTSMAAIMRVDDEVHGGHGAVCGPGIMALPETICRRGWMSSR